MTPDPQAFNACLARVGEAMNEPLLTRCVDFVTDQSCGEWTEAIIFADAVKVQNLVLRETSATRTELAAAYERIAELETTLHECEGHFSFGASNSEAENTMLNLVRNTLSPQVIL